MLPSSSGDFVVLRLKRQLAEAARIEVESLPYDPSVVAFVERWRAAGGRTALVTASDRELAGRIADHLGLFDEVHGSDGRRNLKGEAKAAFLAARFGAEGYVYLADAVEDLPAWRAARKAVTVNAPGALRRQVERLGVEAEHLSSGKRSLPAYLAALRPYQWVKNLLVFLPLVAAQAFDGPSLAACLLAFLAFGLVASAVYVVNDLLDLAADRRHPRKRGRPFAAGRIPIADGFWMAGGLLLAGLALATALGGRFLLVMLAYGLATTAYSLYLKRRTIIDICVLAGLYTLRMVAGGVAAGIPLSVWLLAFSVFLFLSLAAVKRQAELVDSAKRGLLTAHGRGYHIDDLPLISQMALAAGYLSVLVLALYLTSPVVAGLYALPEALWGICLVQLYWISRNVMLAHRGRMHDDPIVFAAKDGVSRLCLVLVLLFLAAGVWL